MLSRLAEQRAWQLPVYGVYPWWPEDGFGWIHPEDIDTVRALIPSQRVFRRDCRLTSYAVLSYGNLRLRVRPTLWQVVNAEGFNVGDQVEIRSHLGKNQPGLAVIREMTWHRQSGEIYYHVEQHGMFVPKRFVASDFRHVAFLC
jgi:hypothetical protein